MSLVYVISHEQKSAQRAVDALVAAHFDATEIRILTRSGREMAKLSVELKIGLRQYVVVGITLLGVVLGGIIGGWVMNHLTLEPLATWMNMIGGAMLGALFGWFVSMLWGLSFWNQKDRVSATRSVAVGSSHARRRRGEHATAGRCDARAARRGRGRRLLDGKARVHAASAGPSASVITR